MENVLKAMYILDYKRSIGVINKTDEIIKLTDQLHQLERKILKKKFFT